MTENIRPLNPGKTENIYSGEHLTQIQHKSTHIDIVDHHDKGSQPVPLHSITRIAPDGSIKSSLE